MKAKLQIRNFGPINDLDIEISKFNILIGPHASGKSTIAKVLCIIHFFDYGAIFPYNEKRSIQIIRTILLYYRVENFLQKDTYWFFEDDIFSFELKDESISIKPKKDFEKGIKTESYNREKKPTDL
jgi:predicted ATPase